MSFRILIADDEEGLRRMMASWLDRIPGVQTVDVGDGNAALAAIRTQKFDIVISDLHMPGLSGVELLREVGALPEPRPCIYILSGMGAFGPEDLEKLGAHGVFEKTQVSALLKAIKNSIVNAS